jgi:hypothetical protein
MSSVNQIQVSLTSKDEASINLSLSDDLSGVVTASAIDKVHVLELVATGPAGPIGPAATVGEGSVDTEHIKASAVTSAKVAIGAITNTKISDGSVSSAKLANLAVTTAKLNNDAVTGAKIADNAIGAEHIADGVIAKELLGSAIIDTSKLEDLLISTIKLQDNAVTGVKIADDVDLQGLVKAHNLKLKGLSPATLEGPDADDLILKSNDNLIFIVDGNQGTTPDSSSFIFKNGSGVQIAALDESGNLIISGTVDGRDLAVDGAKLDGISDNEAIDWTVDQGGTNIHAGNYTDTNTTYSEATGSAEGLMSTAHHDKLDGIEASADVTDATNVAAAGALMDSEVTNLAQVKSFSSADYATAAQGTKADTAQQPPSEGAFANGDKTKLDAIEASADVTDATNVTAAGALMDSELTDLAGVKGVTISTLQVKPSEGAFADGDKTKLDAIEASADVTDATNVTAAGALMDSELTDLAGVKGVTISTLQVKPSEGAFADGDKTKLDAIEASADVTDATNVTAAGALMDSELTDLAGVKGVTISTLQVKPSEGAFANGDKTKLDAIETSADVTDATNVTAAGALMDSELTDLSGIKSLNTSTLVTLTGAQQITGKKRLAIREFAITSSSTHADAIGDVIYIGTGATQAGKIYYYASGGGWTAAQANAASTGTGLLAVALGDDPDVDGMLLRGTVTLGLEIGGTEALGSILYLDDAQAGGATATAPDTTNDIVRVIGYSLSTDDDMIWFNPDGAWVEHA